jgi:hypothetical protein
VAASKEANASKLREKGISEKEHDVKICESANGLDGCVKATGPRE